MTRWAAALLAGLLVCAALAVQLTHGQRRLSGSDDAAPQAFTVRTAGPARVCQSEEALWAGTAELRMTIGAYGRPTRPLAVTMSAGSRVLARGRLAAGWREGVVAIPVGPRPLATTQSVTVCVRATQRLAFGGEGALAAAGTRVNGHPQPARIAIAGLLPGRPSLLDSVGRITGHYAHGSPGWLGRWTFALMLVLALAGVAAVVRGLVGRPDAAGRWAATGAVCLAATWALLTPPFHVPDEPSHYGYVQTIAETWKLPAAHEGAPFSVEENQVLAATHFFDVIGYRDAKPAWTAAEEAPIRAAEHTTASKLSTDADSADNNPPLYYVLELPAYAAGRSAGVLNQLLLMRLFSALLAGATVLFAFAFLRELLPRHPGVWGIGAAAVALQPLFGFISGGVNADAALYCAGAAAFWLAVRLLRRGLTLGGALALGLALLAGVLTKPLFLALVPAGLAALLLAAWRARGDGWTRALLPVAAALALLVVPLVVYNAAHGLFPGGVQVGATSGTVAAAQPTGFSGVKKEIGYIWQLWLPRLPFMNDQFTGVLPLRGVWLTGFVGHFGWLDYGFPPWVTGIVVWIALALLVLAVVGVAREGRRRLPGRLAELVVLGLGLLGVLTVVGLEQYHALLHGQPQFLQARYLLPLLALYGGLIAVAVRGAGRRAAPYLIIVLAGLAVLHELSSLVLTVSRYYA